MPPELPADLLLRSEQEGVRRIALQLLHTLGAEWDRLCLAGAEDEEALHDFRVAVRRLRSWLRSHERVLGKRFVKRSGVRLRGIAQATNTSRDTEVLVAWLLDFRKTLPASRRSGIGTLIARVGGGGSASRATLVSSITQEVTTGIAWLERHLPEYLERRHLDGGVATAAFALTQGLAIRDALLRLRRRLAHVRDADDDRAIHRARLAGKRLRYAIEPMEPWLVGARDVIDALKPLQDAAGDLHDAHVWRTVLQQELERIGADEAQRMLEEARAGKASRASPNRRILSSFRGVFAALDARRDERYAALLAGWSGPALEAFDARVHQLADALEGASAAGIEIERKYLLSAMPPERPVGEVKEIAQGYLPGRHLVERLRHVRDASGESWYRTVKSGSGVTRLELEEGTTADVFAVMWPLTLGKRVHKRRHVIAEGAQVWELDEFSDRALVLAEVELRSATEEVAFPEWLAPFVVRDVTDEPEFVNAALAR